MAITQSLQLYPFHEGYLEDLKNGHGATESHFVSYFGPWLQRLFRNRGVKGAQLQDLVQETFARVLAAVRSQSGIRHPERFGAFVAAVCRNVMLESRRRDKIFNGADVSTIELPAKRHDPYEAAVASEAKRTVERILGKLPPRDRAVLSAVVIEQKSTEQVCRELGLTPIYQRVLLYRAKQRFADFVKKERSRAHCSARPSETGPNCRNDTVAAAGVGANERSTFVG